MIKKSIGVVCTMLLAGGIFTGCGTVNKQEAILIAKEEISSIGSNKDINKEYDITISTYFPSKYLEEGARAFEKQYPDVKIKVNSFKDNVQPIKVGEGELAGDDANPNHTLENYITYLNTSFMSNQVDDMILLSWLPINKYIESSALIDLTTMLEEDRDLTEENYYMNVIKGNTYNDKIYCIPMAYDFKMLGLHRSVLEKIDVDSSLINHEFWDFKKMKELITPIEDSSKQKIYLISGTGQNLFSFIYDLEGKEFIDLENKKLTIDSKAFIQLLEECKEAEENHLLYTGEEVEKHSLFTGVSGGTRVPLYQDIYMSKDVESIYYKPLTNEQGEINRSLSEEIAITKDANNKELCWEFIKFLLSEEMQISPELANSYSVNKKAQSFKIEKVVKKFIDDEDIEASATEEEMMIDLEKKIDKWSNMPAISYKTTSEINEAISKELSPFFEGKQSATDVAAILQNKLYVMLNE